MSEKNKKIPKIRFKEFEGEWDNIKLSEIGNTYNGLTGKSGEDFGIGKKFITYKQVFDNTKINIDSFGFVNILNGEKQNKVNYGDILFTTSSETPNEVGMSSVFLDKIIEDIYLNSFCFGFRINEKKLLLPEFARFYLRSQEVRKKIYPLAQGSTRYNISKNEILKLKISLPTIEEQEKIANFLNAIDESIELKEKELEKLKEYKKGIIQQIFNSQVERERES